jgi:hypothetical protein
LSKGWRQTGRGQRSARDAATTADPTVAKQELTNDPGLVPKY